MFLVKCTDDINHLTASGGNIARHADPEIVSKVSEVLAILLGMKHPHPAVLEKLRSKAEETTYHLKARI